ncbi:44243_t:CDS:2, partial [Gigaspora margarita]
MSQGLKPLASTVSLKTLAALPENCLCNVRYPIPKAVVDDRTSVIGGGTSMVDNKIRVFSDGVVDSATLVRRLRVVSNYISWETGGVTKSGPELVQGLVTPVKKVSKN